MKALFYTMVLTCFVLLSGCVNPDADNEPNEPTLPSEEVEVPSAEEAEAPEEEVENEETTEESLTVEETADEIVRLLKEKDMKALASFIDPEDGVRFSPYGYVDVENDLSFPAEKVEKLWEDETVYRWGDFDGTGDPIDLTFPEYYDRFVYDQDYVNAEERAVDERLGHGSTLDNTKEVYPDATVVEYHFSGFEEQYEGMDWRSLRLVLKEEDERWYLVSVVHDEWTT
jgi:hypothetical protein